MQPAEDAWRGDRSRLPIYSAFERLCDTSDVRRSHARCRHCRGASNSGHALRCASLGDGLASPTQKAHDGLARGLGEGRFVGRSRTALDYRTILVSLGVDERAAAYDPLEKLGQRGFVVSYLFSDGDGVHGWLTPDETWQALAQFDALPLPRYNATLAVAHEQLRQSQPATEQRISAGQSLSLSFVRTVAAIAVSQGRGLLWGNDLPELPASATERHHD